VGLRAGGLAAARTTGGGRFKGLRRFQAHRGWSSARRTPQKRIRCQALGTEAAALFDSFVEVARAGVPGLLEEGDGGFQYVPVKLGPP
jgi:hypothetical protein